MFTRVAALSSLVIASVLAGPAVAEPIYGVTDSVAAAPSLVLFDSANPTAITNIGFITGLVAGQTLRGIDFRPSNGQLYAVSSDSTTATNAQLYTVNLLTGALTTVGSGFTLTGNTSARISIDFNPVVDAIRVVTGNAQNYRVNANTGALILQDTSISPGSTYSDIAYSNNVAGAATTTLYAYDFANDQLRTIGGLNGSPSPNGGTTTLIGSSGVVAVTAATGFDISGLTGIAYATLDATSSPTVNTEFYTVNLATGLHTLVASLNLVLLDISVRPGVAVVPEPDSLAMLGLGFAALAFTLRRRAKPAR